MAESIVDYLARSLLKDDAKGGHGLRSPSEVANACDIPAPKIPNAIDELVYLEKHGKVESRWEGDASFWRTTMSLSEVCDIHPTYIA